MKKIVVVVALCFAGTAFAGDKAAAPAAPAATVAPGASGTTPAAATKKVKGEGDYHMAENLKWESPMGPQGPSFAFVQG